MGRVNGPRMSSVQFVPQRPAFPRSEKRPKPFLLGLPALQRTMLLGNAAGQPFRRMFLQFGATLRRGVRRLIVVPDSASPGDAFTGIAPRGQSFEQRAERFRSSGCSRQGTEFSQVWFTDRCRQFRGLRARTGR